MSPGSFPSHPFPTPDQSNPPITTMITPVITRNFPNSLIGFHFAQTIVHFQFLETFFNEGGALNAREAGIQAIGGNQLFVRSALDDLAVAHDEDLVRFANRA